MSRPRQMAYYKGGTRLFDSGQYEYDAAGNIFAIGADRYIYEQANHLAYGTIAQGGSRWETYVYDAFDNITAGQGGQAHSTSTASGVVNTLSGKVS